MADCSSYRKSHRRSAAQSNYDLKVDGLSLDDVHQDTVAVAASHEFKGTSSTPLVTPIYHSSTYVMENVGDLMNAIQDGGSTYSRLSNGTTEAAEALINSLEKGSGSLTFASGMAAISSVMWSFLKQGDHAIIQIPCYPGTLTAIKHMQEHFGVEVTKVKDARVEDIGKNIKSNTKLIWIETPCNPEIVVVDIKAICSLAKGKDIFVACDSTFASPILQKPISLGVDFSVHSCTKYLGGHSDLIAGCVTTRTVEQWRILKHTQGTLGNMLSPHDASLLIRGIKTLPLRMYRVSETAQKVAEYLEKHPKVARVKYPGLPAHPQHEIAVEQMKGGYGGMIMVDVKGGINAGKTVVESTRILRLAVSLGGVESILEHPMSMTHGKYLLSEEEMAESGILPGMIRVSIGLENADDIIQDFKQALDKVLLEE